jgi:formylglycine-generating enzyme required for sulfatase activity
MAAGQRPFEGTTGTEIATAILSKTPRSLFELRRDAPPKLESVVAKALSKSADERYPSAAELFEELRQISRATSSAAAMPVARPGGLKRIMIVAAAIVMVAMAAAAVWWAGRARRMRTVDEAIKTAERLVKERKLADAYETAVAASAIMPSNERLRELINQSSDRLSIESDPPGATVFLERFKGPAKRVRAGVTPLTIPRLARADYVVTLEKVGYAQAVRPISTLPLYVRGDPRVFDTGPLRVELIEASRVPPEMVFVGGGEYRLSGWSRMSDRTVELRDFLIDRYEVSNRDFQEFVRAGGYRRRDLWKHRFVDGNRTLSFEDATARFRDTTGVPGPRGWIGGAPPAGRENHPVTDVTWYEAAAFAEWKGKKLPTVYEWEKAGRYPLTRARGNSFPWGIVGEGVDATERSNFRDKGTMAVDSMPFGISTWGAYHMAGNVSEWCRNRNGAGFAERGGGWNEPAYAFGRTGAYPGFYTSATLGFRCVKETDGGGGDQGAFALSPSGFVPQYTPVDDHRYNQIRTRYEYAKEPPNARVVEVVQTADWKREKIAYSGGVDRTAYAYLYVPKGFRQPLQVIHFAPAGDVESGIRTLTASIEVNLAPLIRGGRAVFAVLREGYLGRPFPPGVEDPDSRNDEYVDFTITQVTELRRGLDYVQSRHDLDSSRIGFLGPSAGATAGVILTALETRYRSVMFIGTGIEPEEITDAPAASRINFAPRIAAPKLMLQGRYDEVAPLESTAKPMFRLLREPKRLEVFEGGHAAPLNVYVPTVTKWMDETLGPVAQ